MHLQLQASCFSERAISIRPPPSLVPSILSFIAIRFSSGYRLRTESHLHINLDLLAAQTNFFALLNDKRLHSCNPHHRNRNYHLLLAVFPPSPFRISDGCQNGNFASRAKNAARSQKTALSIARRPQRAVFWRYIYSRPNHALMMMEQAWTFLPIFH